MSNRRYDVDGKLTAKQKRAIWRRDRYICAGCGRQLKKKAESELDPGRRVTVDHIIPRARGGTNARSNLQTMCLECNHRKDDT